MQVQINIQGVAMICQVSGCNNTAIKHHRQRRGIGGGLGGEIQSLCQLHHDEAHKIGAVKFYRKHRVITCSDERWEILKERYKINN